MEAPIFRVKAASVTQDSLGHQAYCVLRCTILRLRDRAGAAKAGFLQFDLWGVGQTIDPSCTLADLDAVASSLLRSDTATNQSP